MKVSAPYKFQKPWMLQNAMALIAKSIANSQHQIPKPRLSNELSVYPFAKQFPQIIGARRKHFEKLFVLYKDKQFFSQDEFLVEVLKRLAVKGEHRPPKITHLRTVLDGRHNPALYEMGIDDTLLIVSTLRWSKGQVQSLNELYLLFTHVYSVSHTELRLGNNFDTTYIKFTQQLH